MNAWGKGRLRLNSDLCNKVKLNVVPAYLNAEKMVG